MAHDHSHNHSHQHGGDTAGLKSAFWLNLGFSAFEIIGGLLTGSFAVLSDAVHDLGDSVSLGLSWYLAHVSGRSQDARYSYGYRRFSLLGALINTIVLILGSALVLWRAIPTLWSPEQPYAPGMAIMAVVGIAANGIAVLRLRGEHSLNSRTAALHLLEDVLGWVAVLVVSGVLLIWDVPILDPLLSVLISLYVLYHAIAGLVATMRVFLQHVPSDVDLQKVEQALRALDGVCEVHHAHAWSLDGEHDVFSGHLLVDAETSLEQALAIKHRAKHIVAAYGFDHVTIEIEYGATDCSMGACCDGCKETVGCHVGLQDMAGEAEGHKAHEHEAVCAHKEVVA